VVFSIEIEREDDGRWLAEVPALAGVMCYGVPERQCSRAEYDGKPPSTEELKVLEQAGSRDGVQVLLFTEQAATIAVAIAARRNCRPVTITLRTRRSTS
jgi:hypothetical protein